MPPQITRRQSLKVLGAALAMPAGILTLRGMTGPAEPVRWFGETLGAVSSITLWHPNRTIAKRAIGQMLVEVDRLESIFSLYRSHSEISRLNRDGRLDQPSADLRAILEESRRIAQISQGAFDPTIQPLWTHYERSAGDRGTLQSVLNKVDYTAISDSPGALRLDKTGMAISLNGIAQGYITDRITDILGSQGFDTAMIELGETRALGAAPGGAAFQVGIMDPIRPDRIGTDVALANAALSVSGGYGATVGGDRVQHIFDPHTGVSATHLRQVAVTASRAIWADALSTAIYVAGEQAAPSLLAAYPGARAILFRTDGTLTHC
jgi:thiamine biosynthesis lipoprotein